MLQKKIKLTGDFRYYIWLVEGNIGLDIEKLKVQLYHLNGECTNGQFFLFEESPNNPEMVLVQLFFDEKKLSSESDSFFNALINIRRELELDNIQVACNGAAENVFPSPMQLSMGVGRKAYKLIFGQQARMKDVVDIFAFDKELKFVSISAQAEYYQGWIASLS